MKLGRIRRHEHKTLKDKGNKEKKNVRVKRDLGQWKTKQQRERDDDDEKQGQK